MSNSKLVDYTKLSPNHSGKRTHSIDRITPHCVVGQCSVETLGNIFMNTACEASCNYGIGYDGRVLLCVDEGNRSWCSSSNANDQRAVTIECASDTTAPYTMNSKVYNKLVDLCVDICKRNGKTKLLWFGNESKTLNYSPKSNEMVLTVHRWFANKSCPGDWLYNRLGNLADEVTAQLGGKTSNKEEEEMIKYGSQCFLIRALAKAGRYEEISDVLGYALPLYADKHSPEKTCSAPYAITNCYHLVPSFYGRSGFSFLTGSVAMIERAVYSWVFGLNFALDNIVITPCVPKEYANAEITTPFNGHNLTIKYVGYGAQIEIAEISGKAFDVSAEGRSVLIDKALITDDLTIIIKLK